MQVPLVRNVAGEPLQLGIRVVCHGQDPGC